MRRLELGDDLIEAHRRRVDDARPCGAQRKDLLVHQRAGIETDRAAGDEVRAAEREQVWRAGAGADEMHGHGFTVGGAPLRHGHGGAEGLLAADRVETLDGKSRQRAAEFALRGEHRRLGVEGDGVGDDAAARLQRSVGLVDQRRLPPPPMKMASGAGSASSAA